MKTRLLPCVLIAVASGAVHAQQAASATFANSPPPVGQSASARFSQPGTSGAQCLGDAAGCAPTRSRKPAATAKPAADKNVDRLAVNPKVAVKDTPLPEIDLPGVMKLQGADARALDFSRARVIDVTNGGIQTVYVSDVDQNRFQLPWPNPKVIGTSEVHVDTSPKSNNVYIQLKEGVQRPVTVYFEQSGGSAVLGVQLVPKKIPAQTILVRDASMQAGEFKPVKGNDYVATTQGLMERVALGGAPQGFSQVDIDVGPIAMNGLVISPRKQYSSADRDIYVYEVANPGSQPASLQEQEFDGANVLAISIFPKPVLAPNERAWLIVLTRKAWGG